MNQADPETDTTKGTWIFIMGNHEGNGFRVVVSRDNKRQVSPEAYELEEAMVNAEEARLLLGIPEDRVLVAAKGIWDNAHRSLAARKVKREMERRGIYPDAEVTV
ncbi:MAG: hypothetical protein ACM3UP_02215 [Methanocella sp.]